MLRLPEDPVLPGGDYRRLFDMRWLLLADLSRNDDVATVGLGRIVAVHHCPVSSAHALYTSSCA